MVDVEEIKACSRMNCPKGGIIREGEPTKEIDGKLYHEECVPTQKETESYT
ncbi:MAG: hypothetical protein WCD04_20215 [Terriglobia bacterium]|jgi:hypothetical protein